MTPAAQTPAPALESEALPSASDQYVHTIVRGDTLIGIGEALLANPHAWPVVQRLNRVRDPRRLRPGALLRIPVTLLRHLPGRADVEWVTGRVQTKSADGPAVVALLGATLQPGTTIVTGPDSALRLRLSGGAVVTVGEQTELTLIDLREFPAADTTRTVLGVEQGRVEQDVPTRARPGQHFEIRTPVVTTAVRGTGFRVGVPPGRTSAITEVTEGRVAVGRGTDSVTVTAGFGAVVREGAALPVPRALLPSPRLDATPLSVTRLPVRVDWPSVRGAARYRVEIAPDGETRWLDTRIVGAPEAEWPELPDGRYQLQVRAIDGDGLEGHTARRTVVVDVRPEPPIARAPIDDAVVYGDEVALSWTRPTGAGTFDVQVARDASFVSSVFERAAHVDLDLTVRLSPGAFFWRVASRVGDARGPWSDPLPFTVRPVPPAGPPADLAALEKTRLTLRWAAGPPGARYHVQVARDAAFADLIADETRDEPFLDIARPPQGEYFVRVGLVNAEGTAGPFGAPQAFAIPRPPRSRWWWLLVPAGAVGAVLAGL